MCICIGLRVRIPEEETRYKPQVCSKEKETRITSVNEKTRLLLVRVTWLILCNVICLLT